MINFLHRQHLNFMYEVINNHMEDTIGYGWDGDF